MFRVRIHKGFGHGLRPGTDHDINCLTCQDEQAQGITPVIVEPGESIPDAYMVI